MGQGLCYIALNELQEVEQHAQKTNYQVVFTPKGGDLLDQPAGAWSVSSNEPAGCESGDNEDGELIAGAINTIFNF